ncbi:MAG TPA: 2-oxo acid dehydrogenase subunit E2 [Terriglobales bacterium]|nr:2-oxo acid dehydrogenase subunit E2 [Terriglobales bacterium]
MATEFRIPELGENVTSGDLVKILVAEGDSIAKDQPVVELETDKAIVEVPSSVAGTVSKIHVKAGQKVKVGDLILTVEDGAAARPAKAEKKEEKKKAAAEKPPEKKSAKEERQESQASAVVAPPPPAAAVSAPQPAPATEAAPTRAAPAAPRAQAPASPAIRRFARELGIDINEVRGGGPGGRITESDVKAYVKQITTGARVAPSAAAVPAEPLPDFSKWGAIDRQPMRAIRRATARHLSYAWSTIPHVTQQDKADITSLEQLREKFGKRAEEAGGKLTVTAIAVKIIASALKHFPQFAASIDMAREEVIHKKYCHIGIAVDTERGLLVPVIRDADQKNLIQLSVELSQLAEKARTGKLTPAEMEGGVFSITNLGGIGGTSFSPIVNAPEVAILGLSRGRQEPVFVSGIFQPRLMLPLSLSYDHRLIDGADAARFLRWVADAFEQPFLLPLEG